MSEFTLMGCGPGSRDYLTKRAQACLDGAALLAGSPQLLALFSNERVQEFSCIRGITESWIDRLEATPARPCVVLVDNDRAFADAARRFQRRFGSERWRIEPGVSVVQVVSARLGLAGQEAQVFDFESEIPADRPPPSSERDPWIYFMGSQGAEQIVASCLEQSRRRAILVENLSLTGESVRQVEPSELRQLSPKPRTIVVLTTAASLPLSARG